MALALRKGRLIQKAKGTTIGLGNRWSHLLGAFDLGAGGKSILAIETPHLAGYLLALEMKGGRLAERARRPGFTTHSIGSGNVWEFAVIRRAGAAEIVVQEVSRGRPRGQGSRAPLPVDSTPPGAEPPLQLRQEFNLWPRFPPSRRLGTIGLNSGDLSKKTP